MVAVTQTAAEDCLFCKLIARELPVDVFYENDELFVFRDINPQAPVHLQIIPKIHIATINDLTPEHRSLVGEMYLLAGEVARRLGCAEEGYRLISNCNRAGGQTIFHIHLHFLAGKTFSGF